MIETQPGIRTLALLWIILCCFGASAEVLSEGVEFNIYTTSHPNRAYVLKMDRSNPELMIHMGFPQMKRNHTRQNVRTIASLYDSPPTFDVLGAVNGSFFDLSGPAIHGALGTENSVIQGSGGTRETFFLTDARIPRIVDRLRTASQVLRFEDASTMAIDLLNNTRQENTVALYTPYWGTSTGTTADGVEVIVRGVNYPARGDKWFSGVITEIRTGASSRNNPIASDAMVISARDAKATELLSRIAVGQRVEAMVDLNHSAVSNTALMITGRGWLLNNGEVNTGNWVSHPTSTVREPRTCVAWNSTHIFLVAIDGRQTTSVGMTFPEMAEFLQTTLGATDALNLDGGGSTTMIANGTLRNTPSGGVMRNVANALMVVKKTRAFTPLIDSFPAAGRQLPWDELFTFHPAVNYAVPAAPGGDGAAIHLRSDASALKYESASVGHVSDRDYAVEADVYLDYRPEEFTGDEISGIFARDDGAGMWDYKSFNGGHCYAMAYAADNGLLHMGKMKAGNVIQLLPNVAIREDGWHKFRIECEGSQIRYYLDGTLKGSVTDTDYKSGRAGLGTSFTYSDTLNVRGIIVENFKTESLPGSSVSDWVLY